MALKRIVRLIILLFIQITVLNKIHVAGCITPLALGYMLICFRNDSSRIVLLFYGFAMGLLYDIFSNTPGMASASFTLLAMMQPTVMRLFAPRDADLLFIPTHRSMGFFSYFSYALVCMLIANGAFYLLDAFTLQNIRLTLTVIAGSTVLSTCLCMVFDLIIRKK